MKEENKINTAVEGNIIGTNIVVDRSKENTVFDKNEIMFNVDDDGKVIPEEIDVEVYDKVLDDELIFTTMELDNALTMLDSIKIAFKKVSKSIVDEIHKLESSIEAINKDDKIKDKKILLDKKTLDLTSKNEILRKMGLDNDIKIEAYSNKIKECRKDLDYLENKIATDKVIRKIVASPCTVAESHKYFTKHMWKDDKGNWQSPVDNEDMTYISYLLADKIETPKLTVKEWGMAKGQLRLCFKDAIAEISEYKKLSPREILINNRRTEKIKNFDGECR